ncbi:hypothetical protein GALMADRAFT_136264 [Galerina marginata CBS 339.88]|uniref:Nephrocystin 3-like N-terminal domain-containing protein n=1 Tax=Galerina marginata (strain CBS 339.88) TaxID=685588 RepID=A0A067TFU8_GALM3|nr:hypothetical protein GALMADRAFT_136264 [Galerina marginata CBS 339.88]
MDLRTSETPGLQPMISSAVITGGTFIYQARNQQTVGKGGFERLQDAVVPGALHNSDDRFDPPKCHPNTRLAVLKRIMDWVLRQDATTQDAFIMWLYGPAGAGKSSIAQTIAELCYSYGYLLGSFFFSKNDHRRSTAQPLVATIAYQLALRLPGQVREHIASTIEHNPLIFSSSLEAQLTALVIEPVKVLAESGFFDDPHSPRLIIIDGLDECDNRQARSNVLQTIFQSIQRQSLPLLFLIVSRPEVDISSSFNSPSATSIWTGLALDDSYYPSADIRLFVREKFNEIKQKHRLANFIPPYWPTEDMMETIVERSSGQFIYASTVLNFVASPRHQPTDRLEIVLGVRPAIGEAPFAELDALYTHVFSGVDDIVAVQQILGLLIVGRPYGDSYDAGFFERLYSMEPGRTSLILIDLSSLIAVNETVTRLGTIVFVRILHASLKEFLLDPSRSKNLYISPAERHTEYALLCFQHYKNRSVTYDILKGLFYHSSRALITQELYQDVLELSILEVERAGRLWLRDLTDWVDIFFVFLQSFPWDLPEGFYNYQVKLLDQIFTHHVDAYYSNESLLLALTALTIKDSPLIRSLPEGEMETDRAHLQLINVWYLASDTPKLSGKACPYHQMLIDFLGDPQWSGCYFLDSAKYARAATYAWKYLLSCPSSDERDLSRLAIANLSHLLERSDGTKELVELAQHEQYFGPLEKKCPEYTKLAKDGITKYLARVSGKVKRGQKVLKTSKKKLLRRAEDGEGK